jgi:hypothetical protein
MKYRLSGLGLAIRKEIGKELISRKLAQIGAVKPIQIMIN